MISLDQARGQILAAIRPLSRETVPLDQALHRVAAEPVLANLDVPAFDNASVDGYALRTKDLPALNDAEPVRLRIHATVRAGDPPLPLLPHGTCARIFTGAALPPDANAVILQEETLAEPDDNHVALLASVSPWEGVRFSGEDVRRGSTLVEIGQRLHPAHLGLLAAAGITSITAYRRPRISLITSGNELVDPSPHLVPGKIPDSNRYLLSALAQNARATTVWSAHIADELEPTMLSLRKAADLSDVIVTTGGVSVGAADYLKAAFEAIGGQLDLWRIAVKPGRPFAWGRLNRCHWFGLPGNPVAAFVTWQLLVLPALRRLEGEVEVLGTRTTARLAEPLTNRGDRLHVLRVRLGSDGTVRPIGTQASHIQSGLAVANALLEIPAATAWEAGREVQVELLDGH